MNIKKYYLILCFFSILNPVFADSSDSFLDQFKAANAANKPFPIISTQQSSFSLPMAYELQKKWVSYLLESQNKIGYKAGLTSSSAQKKFNVSAPISGILLSSQNYNNFDTISLSNFYKPFLEVELGFKIKRSISKPISSVYELKSYISEIVTIVEIPEIPFSSNKLISLSDLVSVNTGTKGIIIGNAINPEDINNITVTTLFNNKVIQESSSGTVMEGQYESLMWLINNMLDQGWTVSKDDLLITGAIGPMIPAKKGRYIINYGDLSSLVFELY